MKVFAVCSILLSNPKSKDVKLEMILKKWMTVATVMTVTKVVTVTAVTTVYYNSGKLMTVTTVTIV
jgi:hypothetical protein